MTKGVDISHFYDTIYPSTVILILILGDIDYYVIGSWDKLFFCKKNAFISLLRGQILDNINPSPTTFSTFF